MKVKNQGRLRLNHNQQSRRADLSARLRRRSQQAQYQRLPRPSGYFSRVCLLCPLPRPSLPFSDPFPQDHSITDPLPHQRPRNNHPPLPPLPHLHHLISKPRLLQPPYNPPRRALRHRSPRDRKLPPPMLLHLNWHQVLTLHGTATTKCG